jgi:hypothetical protein
MANKGAGERAIAALHGKDFGGRALNVSEARPKEDRGFQRPHHRY